MEVELGKALGGVLVPGLLVLGPALANLGDGVVVVDGIVVLLNTPCCGGFPPLSLSEAGMFAVAKQARLSNQRLPCKAISK